MWNSKEVIDKKKLLFLRKSEIYEEIKLEHDNFTIPDHIKQDLLDRIAEISYFTDSEYSSYESLDFEIGNDIYQIRNYNNFSVIIEFRTIIYYYNKTIEATFTFLGSPNHEFKCKIEELGPISLNINVLKYCTGFYNYVFKNNLMNKFNSRFFYNNNENNIIVYKSLSIRNRIQIYKYIIHEFGLHSSIIINLMENINETVKDITPLLLSNENNNEFSICHRGVLAMIALYDEEKYYNRIVYENIKQRSHLLKYYFCMLKTHNDYDSEKSFKKKNMLGLDHMKNIDNLITDIIIKSENFKISCQEKINIRQLLSLSYYFNFKVYYRDRKLFDILKIGLRKIGKINSCHFDDYDYSFDDIEFYKELTISFCELFINKCNKNQKKFDESRIGFLFRLEKYESLFKKLNMEDAYHEIQQNRLDNKSYIDLTLKIICKFFEKVSGFNLMITNDYFDFH